MKKRNLFSLLLLSGSLFFTSCGSNEGNSSTEKTTADSTKGSSSSIGTTSAELN